jgi:archaellum component FlaC
MTDTGERLDKVEGRLAKVEDSVVGLRADVDGLRTDVDGLRTDVDGLRTDVNGLRTDVKGLTSRVTTLEEETRKLRILGEENTSQIKLIAEVQSHHGTVLEQHSQLLNQIVKDIEPLKVLPDLVRPLVQDHERRIAALENRDT